MSLHKVYLILKGGKGSGFHGHTGRPGKRGGSGVGGRGKKKSPTFSKKIINEATDFVKEITLSGGKADFQLSNGAKEFLKETVKKSNYKLFRGVGLIRDRVSDEHHKSLNSLKVGDNVPDSLNKSVHTGTNSASYTTKKSVANYYKEGALSIVIQSTVSPKDIIVDTRNLEKIMTKHGIKGKFDKDDYDYFKSEGEVIVSESDATRGKILSKSGKL